MKDGHISETGKLQDLMKNKGAFSEFLTKYLQQNQEYSEDGE